MKGNKIMANNYEEKIIFGMDKIHVAKLKADGTYDAPVAILGAKAVECSYESKETVFRADNNAVYTNKRISSGSGKLSTLGLTNEEKALLTGNESIGGFTLSANAIAPKFALIFANDKADGGEIYNVLYNVTFSVPQIKATSTEEQAEENVVEIDFTSLTNSIEVDGAKKDLFYYSVDTKDITANADVISGFFTSVQTPKKK